MAKKRSNAQTPRITRKQTTSKVDLLQKHAETADKIVKKYAESLAIELGADPDRDVVKGQIKTIGRIFEKATGRLDGKIDKVCDISRFRIYVDTPEQIIKFRKLFGPNHKRMKHNQYWSNKQTRTVRVDPQSQIRDYFAIPRDTGYVGINMNVTAHLGKGQRHIAEIQVMHRGMQSTDNVSHALYEQIRVTRAQAKFEGRDLTRDEKSMVYDLLEENRSLYKNAAKRLGLDTLRINASPYYGEEPNTPSFN